MQWSEHFQWIENKRKINNSVPPNQYDRYVFISVFPFVFFSDFYAKISGGEEATKKTGNKSHEKGNVQPKLSTLRKWQSTHTNNQF